MFTVNGNWGDWKLVGDCSKTCGNGGRRVRVRSCDNPSPSNGGLKCSGASREEVVCDLPECDYKPLPPVVGTILLFRY